MAIYEPSAQNFLVDLVVLTSKDLKYQPTLCPGNLGMKGAERPTNSLVFPDSTSHSKIL